MDKKISEDFMLYVLQNQGIIHKICNTYYSTKADREDLFQEILFNAWKSYPGFQNKSKFSTWLYRVALNTALMKERSIKKQTHFEDIELETLQIAYEDYDIESIKKLYRAIGQLPDLEKSIIILSLDDYSYNEISEITGLTESNVGVKLNRIKSKLKQFLQNI